MDHVELLNDIINAGYVAPVLVDEAEKEHARCLKIAQTLTDAIASMGNKLTVKWGKTPYSTGRKGELTGDLLGVLSNAVNGDKPNHAINIMCTIDGVAATLTYTTKGTVDLGAFVSTLDNLEAIANLETCYAILKARTVDMAFEAKSVEFDGYIYQHYSALSLKEALLADVKGSFCGNHTLRGVLDVRIKDMTNPNKAELASLFFGGVRKSKFNKQSLENKVVATDFGIKNVDDLAAVIFVAYGFAWAGSDCRVIRNAELVNFTRYVMKRVDEAVAYGGVLACKHRDGTVDLRGTFRDRNNANLISFIEFLGGKVPHKVCWRT
jgi:hypothetical protein